MNILNITINHLSHFAKATEQLRAKVDTLRQTLNRDSIIFISVYKFDLSLLFSCQKQNNFPFTLIVPRAYFLFLYFIYREKTLWCKMGKAHEFGHICDLQSMLNSSLVMGVFQKDKRDSYCPAVTLPQCRGNSVSSWPSELISGQWHSWWDPHQVLEVKSAGCSTSDKTALLVRAFA